MFSEPKETLHNLLFLSPYLSKGPGHIPPKYKCSTLKASEVLKIVPTLWLERILGSVTGSGVRATRPTRVGVAL